jgi:hypothetical protein
MRLGRIGLRLATLTQGHITMTDDKIALQDLLEKSSDASLLREMIGFAAQRLMALEDRCTVRCRARRTRCRAHQPSQRLP